MHKKGRGKSRQKERPTHKKTRKKEEVNKERKRGRKEGEEEKRERRKGRRRAAAKCLGRRAQLLEESRVRRESNKSLAEKQSETLERSSRFFARLSEGRERGRGRG